MKHFSLVILVFILIGCTNSSNTNTKINTTQKSSKPQSYGSLNELLVISAPSVWKNVKKDFHHSINEAYPMLPQIESVFSCYQTPLSKIKPSVKKYRNIVILVNLSKPSDEVKLFGSIDKSGEFRQSSETFKYFYINNLWASPQKVCFIVGKNDVAISEGLKENGTQILTEMIEHEATWYSKIIAKRNQSSAAIEALEKEFKFSLAVPEEYQIALRDSNLLWLRKYLGEFSISLFVYSNDYSSEDQLDSDFIIQSRNQTLGKYVLTNTPGSKMIVEMKIPPITYSSTINKHYTQITRGLWRMSKDFTGGPFVQFNIISSDNAKVYTIDCFVYAPGEKKKKLVQELEAIVYSFQEL